MASGLLMAWKGAPGDQGVYWTRNGGAGWEAQRGVGGIGTSEAPALATADGRIYMAWKGVEGDSGAYYSHLDFARDPIWEPQQRIAFVASSAAGHENNGPAMVRSCRTSLSGDVVPSAAWRAPSRTSIRSHRQMS